MRIPDHQTVYVRSMGKCLAVTAIFDNDDAANKYMETHKDEGVISVIGKYVFLANLYDKGIKVAA